MAVVRKTVKGAWNLRRMGNAFVYTDLKPSSNVIAALRDRFGESAISLRATKEYPRDWRYERQLWSAGGLIVAIL
jgi:hypothetical protein